MKVYSIYDSKAEAFMRPFCVRGRGEALRDFGDAAQETSSFLHKHPSDFTLFEIGEFDEFSGKIAPYEAKVPLGTALEYISSDGLREVGTQEFEVRDDE